MPLIFLLVETRTFRATLPFRQTYAAPTVTVPLGHETGRAPPILTARDWRRIELRPYAILNLSLLRSDFLQHSYNIFTPFHPVSDLNGNFCLKL